METTVDAKGRILIPKAMRTALGIEPGLRVDISAYGSGLHSEPEPRHARLVEENGHLVAVSDVGFTDEMMYAQIGEGRR